MGEIEKNNKDKEIEKEKAGGTTVQIEQEGLPKAIIRRLVKDKLSQLSTDSDISLLKDSLTAFSESARIFIHYLSATANDICKESKRQIINAEDVFKALEDIEFPEFIEPLKASLEGRSGLNGGQNEESETEMVGARGGDVKRPRQLVRWCKRLAMVGSRKGSGFREKKRKSSSSKSPESNKKAKVKEPVENGKGKMKELPSDNENEDGQAGEEINEVEDSADD
ncbi:putative protein transport protein SEC24-like [Capsicum annuum]|nr:putative protein transport protein SEC24-like [Capsicum annuum]